MADFWARIVNGMSVVKARQSSVESPRVMPMGTLIMMRTIKTEKRSSVSIQIVPSFDFEIRSGLLVVSALEKTLSISMTSLRDMSAQPVGTEA